ncbi:lipoprotein [Williamsoniiplasma luminosum]|uniref:Lipoprotein n=1 Tax=Williamsoniiplasma luminosum TaxID=214888 RepID=A0A2S0NJK9_9MOLU|nr:lipoprotein [Williamsoniiplasma luminosum]AVP49195.1 MAG: hypothetical protein C5T88_01175 [Williamsoniiplasma luminosum]
MKKLLSLLGTISLVVAISTTVVACGNQMDDQKPKPQPGRDEINTLIKNFENEVTSKWIQKVASPMNSRANFVESEASSGNYNFFSRKNLDKIYNNSPTHFKKDDLQPQNLKSSDDIPQHKKFYEHLKTEEQTEFQNNIKTILQPITFLSEMKKSIRQQMYQVLIGTLGNGWIDDIKFDYQKALLNFTTFENENVNEATNSKFLANIQLGYSVKYSYLDYENQKVEKKLESTISITTSDDSMVIETIKNVQDSLAAKLMKTGSDLVWIDMNDLKDASAEDIVSGKTIKYKNALQTYYEKVLSNKLQTTIKDEYFNSSNNAILKNAKIGIQNPNDVLRNYETISQIGSLKLKDVKLTSLQGDQAGVIDKDELERQKLYLGEINSINKNILYKDLTAAFSVRKQDYMKEFENEYDKIVEKAPDANENNFHFRTKVVNHEIATFKGIELELHNGYIQYFNDINIDLAISIDKKSPNEDTKDGKIFNAYLNGSQKSLEVFHRFYGIKPTEIGQLGSDATKGEKGLLFYMTGKPLGEDGKEIDFNIWDWWKNLPHETFIKDKPEPNIITDGLNLSIKDGDGKAKKMKEENFISKLVGTSNFSFNYSQKSDNNKTNERSFSIQEKGTNRLEGGLRVKTNNDISWTTLQLDIINDLFNIKFGDVATPFDDGKTEFTMIGRKI